MADAEFWHKVADEHAAEITRLRSDNQKLREALVRIAFGGASGEIDDLAGNPLLWSSTTAYLALGGRIEGGTRLDSRELLSGLDSALRTGEEGKSGVDVAEEAKGGSQANVEGSRGMGCQAGHSASENGGEAERERVAINGIIAALLSATKLNLPADVQELLLRGDASRAVPSGILRAMLLAAHSASPIEEAGTADEVSAANTSASLTPHQEEA